MKIGEAALKRVRDYAVDEPSFTAAFAAWDLSRTGEAISANVVRWSIDELARLGIVKLVEDGGRRGKVYAYDPPTNGSQPRRRVPLPDLDAGLGIGSQAPQRGRAVPHTRPEGPSGKPGHDRKRQVRGVRVRRV